jgi:hypothetical protein
MSGSHTISGVDTRTAGMVGVTERGPVEAQLVTGYDEFIELFGASVAAPAPELQAQWTRDGADGGQWWHFGFAVKGFFENGGERLYVKRVVCTDAATLRAADFTAALDAFERFEAVSIVLAPGMWSTQIHAALIAKCEARGRCFAVLDAPTGLNVDQVRDFRAQRHSSYAALYYPWVEMLDPVTSQHMIVPPSGHVAGVYARVDRERGVFKAPANETIHGIERLAHEVTRDEADTLNREGIDTLRTLAGLQKVWGARTLADGDWKYVNVRRLFIFIERSIYEGTQWVVFEPNGEPLWGSVRSSVSDFLSTLWRQGGLTGSTPDKAFFVRCDRTTMTQDDIDQGRLVCEVGIAPVRPAEFVIIRIGRWTADRESTSNASDDGESDPPYVRFESIGDCALLREAIGPTRRVGTLVLVTGANREARSEAVRSLASISDLKPFRIDLSRVVSKYIGETEKNLARIFDAADASDVVLFFDEADALFGKRTEIADSHDRYANLEIGFLLQRIATFEGLALLATNSRSDFTARIRRFARFEVEAPRTGVEATPSLPDLESAVDREATAINLRATGVLYYAAMLEELDLFRVVDRLLELFEVGQLPLGATEAGTRLSQYWERRTSRLSEGERRDLYVRGFGLPGGADDTTPNREFNDLWIRFVSAVASWDPPQRADNDALRTAARKLGENLSVHGCGLSLYAATELGETIRDAIAILSDTDVRSAFGARDMWQVIDRVSTLELGGARNTARYRTMATAGAVVIAWLATHLDRLAPSSTSAMLELPESFDSSGLRLGAAALSEPSDTDLAVACASWLAVAGESPGDVDLFPSSPMHRSPFEQSE